MFLWVEEKAYGILSRINGSNKAHEIIQDIKNTVTVKPAVGNYRINFRAYNDRLDLTCRVTELTPWEKKAASTNQ